MADSKDAQHQPATTRQIQLFTSADGQAQLQVALEHDTLWLSQAQMGELFDTTPENVLMHLKNIFNDGELAEQATTKDFLVVRQEGARQVRRGIKHYRCHHFGGLPGEFGGNRLNFYVRRQWAGLHEQSHV